MIKLTYTNTMATLDTIEHAEIHFQLPHMANFTEACRGLAYCAGFEPAFFFHSFDPFIKSADQAFYALAFLFPATLAAELPIQGKELLFIDAGAELG